jgi:signal transduction histidine kinase
VLKGSGIIPIAFSSSTVMGSGYVLELILMTSGITRQFYIYRKEKEETLNAYLEQQKSINKKIIETQELERKRIGRELHDDIGSGLTQISLMSEAAKHYQRSERGNLKELDDIASTSRRLVNNMGEIIWSLTAENKALSQLLIYLRDQLSRLLEYSGMEYSINFPDIQPEIDLSNAQLRDIVLVTKELVNNSVKYSQAKKVTITCLFKKDRLDFEVKDDGIGMELNTVKSGNGFRNVRARVKELNGSVRFESSPGNGTVCQYSIPLF